jgi:hypothetical protein
MSNTKRPIVDSRDDTDTSIGLMLNECGPRWVFDAAVALQPREKGKQGPLLRERLQENHRQGRPGCETRWLASRET